MTLTAPRPRRTATAAEQGPSAAGGGRPRILLLTTVSHGLETYLRGQPRHLRERWDVTLVSSPGPGLARAGLAEGVRTVGVAMTRSITPGRDLRALLALYRLFRRERPAIVQTYSPKAGLLGMLAARAARVPVRVHGIIGLPLTELTGWRALVVVLTEKITYACATALTCNSTGLRRFVAERLTRRPVEVIGRGSINGVDLEAVRPPTEEERRTARADLGLSPQDCVFAFVGRLVPDKGVTELVEAFSAVHRTHPATTLLLVGEQEDARLPPSTVDQIDRHPAILDLGWRGDVSPVYWAADVVVLPSYREGMPNVVLEAAAAALPVVATDINGSNEVITHGENGYLVPVRETEPLADAMTTLLDPRLRERMGRTGREVVRTDFEQGVFCRRLSDFYAGLLASR